ncbi:MAG: AAA family ATPase [Hyphomicrobiales bacterium]|nr:MAG: AAA family ATPase [Hyphomicrobiales bacterium]
MEEPPDIASLGRRIMIMGPSNSGKSTLAMAMGERLGVPVVYMDRLRHLPNTNWEVRADDEFDRLHDEAILADEWIIEGNYSHLTPQRFARATGALVLTDGLVKRYGRYFRRTLFQRARAGALEGGQDNVNRMMLGWLWKTRHSVHKYRAAVVASGVPHVFASNERELQALYRAWGLTLPSLA